MSTNVWGTDKSLIDSGEFCPDCERETKPSGAYQHYTNCPRYVTTGLMPNVDYCERCEYAHDYCKCGDDV